MNEATEQDAAADEADCDARTVKCGWRRQPCSAAEGETEAKAVVWIAAGRCIGNVSQERSGCGERKRIVFRMNLGPLVSPCQCSSRAPALARTEVGHAIIVMVKGYLVMTMVAVRDAWTSWYRRVPFFRCGRRATAVDRATGATSSGRRRSE